MGTLETVATIIGGISTIMGVIFGRKHYRNKSKGHKAEAEFVQSLERLRDALTLLRRMVKSVGADRAILFAGHNGGGLPTPNTAFYCSMLHAYYSEKKQLDVADDYVGIQVDGPYIQMLIDAMQSDYVDIKTQNMPDGQLKNYYLAEGVTHSIVITLGIYNNRLIYLSAAKQGGEFSHEQKTRILLKSNRLKQIISRF
jgi:hypothetical protein